jgi:hypothetical protein
VRPPLLSGNRTTTVVHCNNAFTGGEGAVVFNKNNVEGGGNCF